ncbi:hypothetical protein ACWDPV_01855 [Gordonia sp. NPDC003504]
MTYPPNNPGGTPNPEDPYGNQGYGNQSYGNQPYGNQPYGGQPQSDQPYGQYPPPPAAPGGYATGPADFDLGTALSYGWNKFKANAGTWIGISLIAFIIVAVINGAARGFDYQSTSVASNIFPGLVSGILSVLVQAAFTRGALDELDGRKPGIGDFFKWNNLGNVFIAAILVWVITTIGYILLIIPGLIATFLLWYTFAFVIDRNLSAVDGLKASFNLTSKNVGSLLLLAVVVIVLNIVGAILCGVGLLVSAPVTLIASTYAYRTLSGGAVSPAQ